MANCSRLIAATVGPLIGLAGSGTLAWNEYHLARQLDAVAEARAGLARPAPIRRRLSSIWSAPSRHGAGDRSGVRHHDRRAAARSHRRDLPVARDPRKLGRQQAAALREDLVAGPDPSDRFEQRSFHANPRSLRLTTARFRTVGATIGHEAIDPALIDALPAIRELHPEQGGRGPRRGPRVHPQRRLAVQRRSRHAGGGRCPRAVRRSAGGL